VCCLTFPKHTGTNIVATKQIPTREQSSADLAEQMVVYVNHIFIVYTLMGSNKGETKSPDQKLNLS